LQYAFAFSQQIGSSILGDNFRRMFDPCRIFDPTSSATFQPEAPIERCNKLQATKVHRGNEVAMDAQSGEIKIAQ